MVIPIVDAVGERWLKYLERKYIMGKKYVMKGVSGGWRIWNNKQNKWWGDFYELQPDEIVLELNGENRQAVVIELTKKYRKAKR